MNYTYFADFLGQMHDKLVQEFDVPASDASLIVANFEADAMNAASRARSDKQLVINYRELGPSVLAERMGCSRETVRKRYREAIAKRYAQGICT